MLYEVITIHNHNSQDLTHGKPPNQSTLYRQRYFCKRSLSASLKEGHNPALSHILRVERDIVQAAANLRGDRTFTTAFPRSAFGNAIRTVAQVASARVGVAAIKISLGGFDTHSNQPATQARLLKELRNNFV